MRKTTTNTTNRIYADRVLGYDDTGLLVRSSTDTRKTDLNNHCVILGASGSGKTGSFLTSTLAESLRTASENLIVTDAKGTLKRLFADKFREKGYTVLSLDFDKPMNSMGYNPLKGIRRHEDGSIVESDLMKLAEALCPSQDNRDAFWDNYNRLYMSFLLAYCLNYLPEEDHNLTAITNLHTAFLKNPENIGRDICQKPDKFTKHLYERIRSCQATDRTWASITAFTTTSLMPYTYKEAEHLLARNRVFVDIRKMCHQKSILFVNVSSLDNTFRPIVNAFYSQMLSLLIDEAAKCPDERLPIPTALFIDDAANCKISGLADAISVVRSYDISLGLLFQNMTQLTSIYGGPDGNTILSNCDRIIYLSSNTDSLTAEFMAQRCNMPVSKVYTIPRNKLIYIEAGQEARLLTKIAPYSALDTLNTIETEPHTKGGHVNVR